MKIRFFRVLNQKVSRSRGSDYGAYKLKYDELQFDGAACVGIDTEFFYPPRDKFQDGEAALLKRMCLNCPVKQACLEWGLTMERYGVWGGTTPYERFSIRKQLEIVVSDPQYNS